MVAISPRGPALGRRFGPKRVVTLGLCIVPVALLALSFITATVPYIYVAFCLVAMALGPALAVPTMSTGIVLSLPLDKAGVGSAVNDTTREVGGAIGIAVFGSILSSQYRSGLKPVLAQLADQSSPVVQAAQRGVGVLAGLVKAAPKTPGLQQQLPQLERLLVSARAEFVHGMQSGFRVAAVAMVVVAAVVAKWYPKESLQMGVEPAAIE